MSGLPRVYIAFQGGGVLGMAHVGAFQELAKRFDIVGVGGTSAGSIVAALCAAGYDPHEVERLLLRLDWRKFTQRQRMIRLIGKRDGLVDPSLFEAWLRDQLAERFYNQVRAPTFTHLRDRTGMYLAVLATDLNDEKAEPVIFDSDAESTTSVAFAVRASISIPGYFVPAERKDQSQVLVDGGLLMNLPLQPLIKRAKDSACLLVGVRFARKPDYLENPTVREVLGRSLEILLARSSMPPQGLIQDPSYLDITIDAAGFNTLDFNLSQDRKLELIRRGRLAVLEALDHRASDRVNDFVPQSEAGAMQPDHGTTMGDRNDDLSDTDRGALLAALLKCGSVRDEATLAAIVRALPEDVQLRAGRAARLDVHVGNILDASADSVNGIERLVLAVGRFERGSRNMTNLENVWRDISSTRRRP